MTPRVSIIMPVYNVAPWLAFTLRTVQAQTFADWECLVIDDGSSDASACIVTDMARHDPRIRLIPQVNAGVSAARNRGLDEARGEFVTFLDGDDLWRPHTLNTLLTPFADDPSPDFVWADFMRFDDTTGRARPTPLRDWQQSDVFWHNLLIVNFVPMGVFMLRAVAIGNTRFDTSLRIGEDRDWLLRVLKSCTVVHVPELVHYYRQRAGSAVRDTEDFLRDETALMERHLADPALSPRIVRRARSALAFHAAVLLAKVPGKRRAALRELVNAVWLDPCYTENFLQFWRKARFALRCPAIITEVTPCLIPQRIPGAHSMSEKTTSPCAERGSRWKRIADLWCGVPLTALLALYQRLTRQTAPQPIRRIGILSVGAIGDLLLASCIFQQLRTQYPEARITLLCSRANAAAVPFVPCVDESRCFAVTDLPGLVRAVRAEHFDLLLDTGQWARFGALVCALSGAGRTVGFRTPGQFRHFAFDATVLHRNDRHELNNFLELGRVAALPALDDTPDDSVPTLQRPAPSLPAGLADFAAGKPLICCHRYPSGTRSYLKEWPAAYWAVLMERLTAAGLCVVLTGSPADRAGSEAFRAQLPELVRNNVFNAAGCFSLWDETAMLQTAAALVSVNTGFGHLGGLLGVPTVDIHGPTNPARWGVVGPHVRRVVPDSGGGYLNLGFEYPAQDDWALERLPVEKVLTALQELGIRIF